MLLRLDPGHTARRLAGNALAQAAVAILAAWAVGVPLAGQAVAGERADPDLDRTKAIESKAVQSVQRPAPTNGPTVEPGRAAAQAVPAFSAQCKNAADRAVAELADGRLILTVTSPGGIGSATVTRQRDDWPKKILLRLLLKGLEGFTVGNGRENLKASINSQGAISADKGLTLTRKDGSIHIVLPEGFLAGDDKLTFSWGDFYR